MHDISKGGIPIVLVGTLLVGVAAYSNSIESRFTKLEVGIQQVKTSQDETKLFFKEFIGMNKEFQIQNQKIYEKLNDNLATMSQRLVILETLAKGEK